MIKTKTTTPRKLPRGGKRDGAGRPQGSGKYGEPTKAIRVPHSLVKEVQTWLLHHGRERESQPEPTSIRLPLFDYKVAAGFPSPAEDSIALDLDLNEYVIKNPSTSFYVKVEGFSMRNAGIFPGDLLVVDRSLEPHDGNIVIAYVDGEFTVKRLKKTRQQIQLVPENEDYPILTIKDGMDFRVWGVVTNVIHTVL
jgi:DNA polymerase V